MNKEAIFENIDNVRSYVNNKMQLAAADDYARFAVSYAKDILLVYCEELKHQIEKSVEEENETIKKEK